MKVIITVLALTGCKPAYDSDRFLAVCSAGTGYGEAAAYAPASAGSDAPVAMVRKYAGLDSWVLDTPRRFYEAGVVAPAKDNVARVQLALCIDQQPGPFDRDCTMGGFDAEMKLGDGDPKVKVKETGREEVVKVYGSHYVLTVREARTGRVIATRALDVKVKECPSIVLGNTAAERSKDYADIEEDELVATLAPHLPKPVADRLTAGAPR